jgi:hypothetical protein
MNHVHRWILVSSLYGRYGCEGCRVLGYRRGNKIAAFKCQHELAEHKHCGKAAVVVEGRHSRSRCEEHMETGAEPPTRGFSVLVETAPEAGSNE